MLPFSGRSNDSNSLSGVSAGWRLAALVLVVLALPCLTYSQILYGSLTGTVTDQTGAVFTAGAKITAANVATNVSRTATTDNRGNYLFSDLQPGTYTVTIDAPGFKTLVRKNVRINTNATQRVDAQLQVSEVSETVEVSAAPPALQTDRADVHVTQSAREVNNLPLGGSLGRNYQSLMAIVPGAVIQQQEAGNGEANSQAGSPQRAISFSANGVSGWINQTTIDGSSDTYVWLPTNTAYVPSAEAIEEVSITTNSYSADQGLAGGAAINVVVKSGTNTPHATIWGYDTNSHFTARNEFQTTPRVPKNIVAQFGGNLGGPIVKDKLFFFGNIERTTNRVGAANSLNSVAPQNLRPNGAGDVVFPTPAQDPVNGAIIYDPLSNANPALRTPFLNNTIPASRLTQGAKYLLARLPLPTGPGYVNNTQTLGATQYNRTNMDFKANYAGRNMTVFARYGNSPSLINDEYALDGAGGPAAGGGQLGRAPGRTQVLGVGLTYTFNETTMLDANFGYTHQVLGAQAPDIGVNVGSDPDKMGIPGTNGPDPLQGGLPSFAITGWTTLGNPNTGNPFQFRDNQYTGTLNIQKTAGAHLFRAGAAYQNQQINHFQPQGGAFQTVRGSFQFNGNATSLQNNPAPPANQLFNSWADFLLGLPSAAGKVSQLVNPNSLRMRTYAAYVQDTWRASKALTLLLGVRWEFYPFPTRPGGKGVNRFDTTDGNVYIGGYGSTPQNTFATSGNGRFLPRAGLTYRINDKTVVRAGFGMSADPSSFIQFRDAYPTVFIWQMPQIAFNGVANPFIPVTTFTQGLVQPAGSPDITSGVVRLPANTSTNTYPKNANRKYIDSWNLSFQRELTSWLTGQIAYVGTDAVGQMNFVNVNAGPPGGGDAARPLNLAGLTTGNVNINVIEPYGDTKYEGLQAQLQARAGTTQVGIAYTFSRTTNFADNQGGNAAGAGAPRIQYLPAKQRNKGLAGYDRRHVFQLYGVWDLPFGKGRQTASSGAGAALLGGWQINGILSIMSGTPIYIVQGNAYNLQAAGSAQVPDQIAPITVNRNAKVNVGGPPAGANPVDYQYFSVGSFKEVNIPAGQQQRFGNNGRNNVPGPNFWNVDLGLFRTIDMGPVKLQLRAESLNILNHPNFRSPGGAFLGGNDVSNTSQFGYITQLVGTASRTFRFGVRMWF